MSNHLGYAWEDGAFETLEDELRDDRDIGIIIVGDCGERKTDLLHKLATVINPEERVIYIGAVERKIVENNSVIDLTGAVEPKNRVIQGLKLNPDWVIYNCDCNHENDLAELVNARLSGHKVIATLSAPSKERGLQDIRNAVSDGTSDLMDYLLVETVVDDSLDTFIHVDGDNVTVIYSE